MSTRPRPMRPLWLVLMALLVVGVAPSARATHFRYGNLTWKARPDVATNAAEMTLLCAFRRDGYSGSGTDGHPITGDVIDEDIGATGLNFGDGQATGELNFIVISYDLVNNYIYCRALASPSDPSLPIVHTYSGPGPWTPNVDSSARISNSVNAPGGEYRVETTIYFPTTTSSPVSTLPPVVQCAAGGVATFNVPAADAEGDSLTWRLATPSEDGYITQPSGLSISAGGTVAWNTAGLQLGLYSCQVVIEAHDHASGAYKTKTAVDFLLDLTQNVSAGTPPRFVQSAPLNGSQFVLATGKALSFSVSALSDNPGGVVTLNSISLPTGAVMSPPLPLVGNPGAIASSTFAWTPASNQTGPTVVVFTATDGGGRQATCSIVINVMLDSDGDGIPDDWELHGYTYNGHFVNLPAMGANPYHKDIFVQADYMIDGGLLGTGLFGHSHKPNPDAVKRIVQSFANAPVSNPDGATGINLHVTIGNAIPEVNVLGKFNPDGQYDWTSFDALKAAHFPQELSLVEHYCIFAHQFGSATNYSSGTSRCDFSRQPAALGSDFIVSLGSDPNNSNPTMVGTMFQQAGTFMHELGHTLGLQHGGGDSIQFKPNYLSVMNYSFQFPGLHRNGTDGLFDYSRFDLPPLDENSLYEAAGLGGGGALAAYGTTWYVPRGAGNYDQKFTGNANAAVDWNGDGVIATTFLESADIHQGQSDQQPQKGTGVLTSFNDWAHLNFNGGLIGAGLVLPQPSSTPSVELSFPTAANLRPFPPSGIAGRAGPRAVRLAWTALGPITEYTYRVYVSVGGSPVQLLATTTAPLASFTGLTSGSAYTFYVTSVSALGAESDPAPAIIVAPL